MPTAYPSHEHPSNASERRCLPSRKLPQVKAHSLTFYKNKNASKKVGGPLYLALFIQEVQDPKFRLYKVYTGLVIVEVYESPRDSLLHVLFLFQLKHVLRVEKQQLLTVTPASTAPAPSLFTHLSLLE